MADISSVTAGWRVCLPTGKGLNAWYLINPMSIRSHKIALDTTFEHRSWFSQQCGYARFAFNYALSDFKDESRHWKELNKRFNIAKRGIEWAKDMDQRAALFGIKNLGDAISRWRSGQNRFPKKKKRRARQSYSTDPNTVTIKGKRIRFRTYAN